MKYSYKNIDTRNNDGIIAVEKLIKSGWKIINIGFWHILLEKIIR